MCIICQTVLAVRTFEDKKTEIPSIDLHINCPNLKGIPEYILFPKLVSLSLICSKLEDLSNIPNKLSHLLLSSDVLTILPPLPELKTLTLIRCGKLASIVELPPKLREFSVESCPHLLIFPIFPESLETLKISNSPLVGLENLPQNTQLEAETRRIGLKSLSFSFCPNLTLLPRLPTTLQTLQLSGCPELKSLPELPAFSKRSPNSLDFLRCHMCGIESLPNLPLGLQFLEISDCPIDSIPFLPDTLILLKVSGCRGVKYIPSLPDTLRYLYIESCNLKSLPKTSVSVEAVFI